jgi:ABC-type multidrug transport system ATPase subunit
MTNTYHICRTIKPIKLLKSSYRSKIWINIQDKIHALNNVSQEIQKGNVYGILGLNN